MAMEAEIGFVSAHVARQKIIVIGNEKGGGAYLLYSGDAAVSRKGEILIWQPNGS